MTREQDRARAHRRAAKLDAKQAQKEREAARTRQAVVVVLAMLAVVAGFVFLTAKLKGDKAPAAAPTGHTASATAPAVAGCSAPPATPSAAKKVAKPDKAAAAGKTFTAVVTTNCGDITLELDGAKAPQTVASVVGLARAGYYDSSPCARVTASPEPPLYVLQCGDPLGGPGPGPGYSFGVENAPKDGKYPKGSVAMARGQDPNTNADQFFIVYKDSDVSSVPAGYSIFGTVTSGMDIVEKIAAAGVSGGATDGAPAAPISILKVAVTEKKA